MVEAVGTSVFLEAGDGAALEKRNYNGDPVVKVPGHAREAAFTRGSVSITKKCDKESSTTTLV